MPDNTEALATLVASIRGSAKYRDVCTEVISNIGARELAKRRSLKEAIQATRNTLHQVSGAYLNSKEHYSRWLAELRMAVQAQDNSAVRDVCTRIMSSHASTRERLPNLDQFYAEILAQLPPIHSIVDIACGLNPLTLPWMSLASDATYYAYDISESMMGFLSACLPLLGVQGDAQARDVLQSCPMQKVNVAFLLKAIPCLEQIDKRAGHTLLHVIQADAIVVSFPVRSLGGRNKGMVEHYDAHFRTLVANEPWDIQRFEFSSELVFLVRK
ncbi:MAG: 16S rRNA methyltransferase [Ktedonobacteraceae bacterium]